jgi:hypothetical protein
MVPIGCLVAAYGVSELLAKRGPATTGTAVGALGLAIVAETALFFGNPLAFSNSLILPKRDAYRLLADSNLDWNQGWQYISDIPELNGVRSNFNPLHILPGYNVFSLNALTGVDDNFEQYAWVREHLMPVRHHLHTYLVYRIDQPTFERFLRDERYLTSLKAPLPRCPNVRAIPRDLSVLNSVTPAGNQSVCVHNDKTLIFGVEGKGLVFGPLDRDGEPMRRERLTRQAIALYLLEPGDHVFRLETLPGAAFVFLAREASVSVP